jgi:hypothetical protein
LPVLGGIFGKIRRDQAAARKVVGFEALSEVDIHPFGWQGDSRELISKQGGLITRLYLEGCIRSHITQIGIVVLVLEYVWLALVKAEKGT